MHTGNSRFISMEHSIHPELLTKQVNVLVVGAGGTGSRVIEALVNLHRALIAKGHPGGLNVTAMDADIVSQSNIGRQAFYQPDVGTYKAITLVNRANMALNGTAVWKASTDLLDESTNLRDFQLVIGAVDNRLARYAIMQAMMKTSYKMAYWLDFGNKTSQGQAILGEIAADRRAMREINRLPHAGELFPDLVNPLVTNDDDGPSCSLAEALERQSLYINQAVTIQGMSILWNLFIKGVINNHGAFIDLDQSTVLPMRIDPTHWARFGFKPKAPRKKAQTA